MKTEWRLWDWFETLPRILIITAVGSIFALSGVQERALRICMVILMVWAFYPAGRFVYYSFKEAFKKQKGVKK